MGMSNDTQAAQARDAQMQEARAEAQADENRADGEALAKLMEKMAQRREVLVGIMEYCQEAREVAEVDAHVASLQAHNASVYDGAALCAMLRDAGGLEQVTAPQEGPDGQVAACDSPELHEPLVEVEDGVEYLRPAPPTATLWKSTEAAKAYLESCDPRADLARLLEDDAQYMDIYLRVLDLCADEDGASTPDLGDAVDSDPLVQSPRLFAQHFTERLEKAGAVAWGGRRWKITDTGRSWLEGAAR